MAWDVAIAGQAQVRVAPSGAVIGFDLPALLTLGAALGAEVADLAQLLPAIEAGLVAGLARQAGGSDGDDPDPDDPDDQP